MGAGAGQAVGESMGRSFVAPAGLGLCGLWRSAVGLRPCLDVGEGAERVWAQPEMWCPWGHDRALAGLTLRGDGGRAVPSWSPASTCR